VGGACAFSATAEEARPVYPGQPLFLPNGTLIGTLADQWSCGSGGCWQEVYRFDWPTRQFMRHSISDSSAHEGEGHVALSGNGQILAAFDSFHVGCEYYTAAVGVYDLTGGGAHRFTFDQESFYAIGLSPKGTQAVVARQDGCAGDLDNPWSETCGIYQDLEIYAMQLLDLTSGARTDLVPGVDPAWSPRGDRVAFQSCLAQTQNDRWEVTSSGPPQLFVMMLADGVSSVTLLSEGGSPAWRPLP